MSEWKTPSEIGAGPHMAIELDGWLTWLSGSGLVTTLFLLVGSRSVRWSLAVPGKTNDAGFGEIEVKTFGYWGIVTG